LRFQDVGSPPDKLHGVATKERCDVVRDNSGQAWRT
jgi:hypothetical protein